MAERAGRTAAWRRFPVASVAGGAGALLLVGWAALQVRLVWRSNPVLWGGEGDNALGVFSGLFAGDWSFSLENSRPPELLSAALVAGLSLSLGVLALRAARLRLKPLPELAMGYLVGMGLDRKSVV